MAGNRKANDILSWGWLAVGMAGGAALLDALALEPNRIRVRRLDVPVDDPGGPLVGLRLAHLSDLHVGALGWRLNTMREAVDLCHREDVDLIVITGDFLGRGTGAPAAIEILSRLRTDVPRLAVLGNHDHVYGGRPLSTLLQGLEALGIRVLQNESVPLDFPSGRVWFVGVDDAYSMRDDLDGAMAGLGPEDFPRVLLTHYPDVAERVREGAVQLSLAGHSHGGQIRVPVLAELVYNGHARTRYGCGLYSPGGNPLHVSPGLGMSGVPMRFRNLPEVTVLRMVPSLRAEGRLSLDRSTAMA